MVFDESGGICERKTLFRIKKRIKPDLRVRKRSHENYINLPTYRVSNSSQHRPYIGWPLRVVERRDMKDTSELKSIQLRRKSNRFG